MAVRKIIDISRHNGENIDFEKVKRSGYIGVIVRAGYGKGNVDSQFTYNIQKAKEAGLSVGVYWFSYAYTKSMAVAEAAYCYNIIKKYKLDLPVYFDWEYDSERYAKNHGVKATGALIKNMTLGFMDYIISKGYRAGFYFNNDYVSRGIYVLKDYSNKYSRWYARYGDTKGHSCDIWQYSESGKVSGINSTQVDLNKLLNYDIITFCGPLPSITGYQYFKVGDHGEGVKRLQWFLMWKGLYNGDLDAIYGSITAAAVRDFQVEEGIKDVNGCWGRYCQEAAKKYHG